MRSSLALAPLMALAACVATPQSAPAPPALHAETFGASGASARTLIIVLHADGTPEARSDHARFADTAARQIPGSAAVALLRPGYSDAAGHRSPGARGDDVGDNYTADRIGAVGDAIAALRRRYPQARTLVVGDEGGAALAANLAGIRPGLIDAMLLVACPCALPEWRSHMEKRAPAQPWERPVTSLDPLKTAGGVAPTLRAVVMVGADDKVTPAALSRSYAEALALRGIATDYRILPGKGHALLDDPEVLSATRSLAAALAGNG